jgi:Domain of unknown function (DUF1963)
MRRQGVRHVMAGAEDLKGLNEAELVRAYIDYARTCDTTENVGKHKRLFGRRLAIVEELKARGVAHPVLRRLLGHSDAPVRSWAQSDFDRLDRPKVQVPPDRPLRSEFQWQCDNPPPRSITRDEIVQHLRNALPEFHDLLISLALPAIGLWPRRAGADSPDAASRLGGMPLAPPDWQWPVVDDEPLLFVGQINCAEIRGMPGAGLLPSSGLLAFFGEHDGLMGCRIEARHIAICHWTDVDNLVPAVAPIEPSLVFPLCTLTVRALLDLPDPKSLALEELGLNEEQTSRYAAAWKAVRYHGIPDGLEHYCAVSKLLGWPALVQWHDLDCFDLSRKKDARLLLQFDDYCNGQEVHFWGGGGGSIYFHGPEKDLRKRRYDRCEFDIQFT